MDLDDAAVIEASRAEPDRFAFLFDRHAPHIHRSWPAGPAARPVTAQSMRASLAGALATPRRRDLRGDPDQ